MPGPLDGPLGQLPNMFYDPVRNKYFPNPRHPTAVPNQPRQERPSKRPPSPSRRLNTGIKPTTRDPSDLDRSPVQGSSKANEARQKFNAYRRLGGTGRTTFGSPLFAPRHEDRMRGIDQDRWTNLRLRGVDDIGVHGVRVVNLFADTQGDSYIAIYDNGLGMSRSATSGDISFRDIWDTSPWHNPKIDTTDKYPRGFVLRYEEDYDLHEYAYCNLGAIDGLTSPVQPENFVCSSLDKSLVLGHGRAIVKYDFYTEAPSQDYLLAPVGSSDMLTLDHSCRNMVYAGLRNSQVMSGDFRDSRKRLTTIASLKHKAVVKVKRLCDSAVPFGLLVSGMGDKLVIFDIRFSKQPLRELAGHVNPFHSDLGMTTTTNGRFLFAGQSDRRVRAWSLVDGQRLLPDDPEPIGEESNDLLSHVFRDRPTAMAAGEQILSVGVKRAVFHFGPNPGCGCVLDSDLRSQPALP